MNIELRNKLRVCGVEVSDDGAWLSPVNENNYTLFHKLSTEKQILGIDGEAYNQSMNHYLRFCTVPIECRELKEQNSIKLVSRIKSNHHYRIKIPKPCPEGKIAKLSMSLDGFFDNVELNLHLETEKPTKVELSFQGAEPTHIKEFRIKTGESPIDFLGVSFFAFGFLTLDKLSIEAGNIAELELFPRKEIDFEFIGKEPSQLRIDNGEYTSFNSFVVNGKAINPESLERVTDFDLLRSGLLALSEARAADEVKAGRLRRNKGDFLCTSKAGTNGKYNFQDSENHYDGEGALYQPKVTCKQCLEVARRKGWIV